MNRFQGIMLQTKLKKAKEKLDKAIKNAEIKGNQDKAKLINTIIMMREYVEIEETSCSCGNKECKEKNNEEYHKKDTHTATNNELEEKDYEELKRINYEIINGLKIKIEEETKKGRKQR